MFAFLESAPWASSRIELAGLGVRKDEMMESKGVFIRNRETGKFYQQEQKWTREPREALRFENLVAATEFAWENGLSNVEVVLAFDDGSGRPCLQAGILIEPPSNGGSAAG